MFNVEFLEQALIFLTALDTKTRAKILENIRIARFKKDPKLLKKIDKDIWEFRTKFNSHKSDFWLFGIRTQSLLLYVLMDS